MKKKILALMLIAAMLVTLVACAKSENSTPEVSEEPAAPAEQTTQPEEGAAPEENIGEEAPAEDQTEEPSEPESDLPEEEVVTGIENFTIDSYNWGTVALPIVEETKTFSYYFSTQPFMMSYAGAIDYGALPYFEAMEELTGIRIEVVAVNLLEASEKFNLMIVSGEYTNLIEGMDGYSGGVDLAIEDEVIYCMDDIIPEYMPNYQAWLEYEPEFKLAMTSPEGHYYGAGYLKVGNIASTTGGLIRQDWLDDAGLDVPITYDQMETALEAFKNNEHPNALWMNTGLTDGGSNFNLSAGYDVSNGLIVKDGKVAYSFVTDDFRDYVEMLNRWWEKDYIYTDFINVDGEIDQGLVMDGDIAVWSGSMSNAEIMENAAVDGLKVSPFSNLRKTEDQQLHICIASTYAQGSTSISTATSVEDVEYLAKWLDFNYTYEGFMLCNYGEEGVSYVVDENGEPRLTDLVVNSNEYITPVGIVLYTRYGGAGICYDKREYFSWDERDWEACDAWSWNNDADYVLPLGMSLSVDEAETASRYFADIKTYVQENLLKFITGETELDKWDEYIAVTDSLGMKEVLDSYQSAYERYINR